MSQGQKDNNGDNDAIVQLIKLYQNAPPKLLGVIVILGLVSIVTLAFALTLIGSRNQGYALGIFAGFLLFSTLAVGIFLYLADGKRQEIKVKVVESIWDRLILKYPPSRLNDLKNTLDRTHQNIREFIKASISSTMEGPGGENLRTKIFLPKYKADDVSGGAGKGYVCFLVMPSKLKINMSGHTDDDLQLRPGEGISGKAFVTGEAKTYVIGRSTDDSISSATSSDVDYMIFPDNLGKVNKDIKWIVSVPLDLDDLKENRTRTVGVLSLDCLRNSITNDDCERIKNFLLQEKTKLEAEIAKCERIRLYVGIQER